MLLPYRTRYRIEPISELLSIHLDRYVETLSLATQTSFSIEPVHEISNNGVCATSKASDQPAHTRSLIRAFASRLSIL